MQTFSSTFPRLACLPPICASSAASFSTSYPRNRHNKSTSPHLHHFHSTLASTGTLTAASVAGDIDGAGTSEGFTGTLAADTIANLIINRFAGTLTVPHIVSLYLESDLAAPLSISGNIDLLDIHGSITKDGSVTSTAGNVHVLTTAGIIGSVSGYTGVTVQTGASFTFTDLFDGELTSSGGFYSDLYVSNTLLLGNGYHFSFLADPALGDITGQIDVVTGNIDLTATGRVSSAKSHAIHTTNGNITLSAGKDISETILTDSGTITSISTPRNITASITTTSGDINTITAGGDIAGTITATGTINSIYAGGSIGGTINATVAIGDSSEDGIIAGEDITATIDPPAIRLMKAGRDVTTGADYSSTVEFTTLDSLVVGRDFYGNILTGTSITTVNVGRDLFGSITLSGNIGNVYVGRYYGAWMVSSGGSIGNILVGATTADGGLWANPQTVEGSIVNHIQAHGDIGTITVHAAPGLSGAINSAAITSDTGNIGAVSAVSGINAAITAATSIGNVTTAHGDIIGSITATAGNIPLVAADNGTIAAPLTAGGSIGPVLAGHNITGAIVASTAIGTGTASYNSATITGVIARSGTLSGNITSSTGSIGNIAVGTNLSGNLQAYQNIGNITVGAILDGNLRGTVNAQHGSIGSVTVGGEIAKADHTATSIHAAASIGDITAQGAITATISADSGSIASVTAWGMIKGNITAGTTIGPVDAVTLINGNITAGSGKVAVFCAGKMTGKITAPGNIAAVAAGNALEKLSHSTTSDGLQMAVVKKAKPSTPPKESAWSLWDFFQGFGPDHISASWDGGQVQIKETSNKVADTIEDAALKSDNQAVICVGGWLSGGLRADAGILVGAAQLEGHPIQSYDSIVEANGQLGARTLLNGGSEDQAFADIFNNLVNPLKGMGEVYEGVDLVTLNEVKFWSVDGSMKFAQSALATGSMFFVPQGGLLSAGEQNTLRAGVLAVALRATELPLVKAGTVARLYSLQEAAMVATSIAGKSVSVIGADIFPSFPGSAFTLASKAALTSGYSVAIDIGADVGRPLTQVELEALTPTSMWEIVAAQRSNFKKNPMFDVTQTTPTELIKAARGEFDSTGLDRVSRANFLRQFAGTSDAQAFFSEEALARMNKGLVPEGWEVHHMQPLFRGGDNFYDNLILVPEEWHRENFFELHFYAEGKNPFGRN